MRETGLEKGSRRTDINLCHNRFISQESVDLCHCNHPSLELGGWGLSSPQQPITRYGTPWKRDLPWELHLFS